MMTRSLAPSVLCALTVAFAASPAGAASLAAPSDPHTIVGGDVNSGDPAVPFLVVYGEQGEQSVCTGSLVAPQWILTAAHCVDAASLGFAPAALEAYFGREYSQADPGYLGSAWADGFTLHENWNANDLMAGNDIAVVHLEQPVNLPVMPLMNRPLQDADRGAPVRLIGWGITGGGGQDSGLKRHVMSALFDFDATLVQIGNATTNVCSGDSGGPAVMAVGGHEVQIGITSFGDTDCAQFGIDTRVDAFADWIAAATDGEVTPSSAPTPGGEPGGPGSCHSDADCAGGVCVSDGGQNLCTSTCSDSGDCPAGLSCFATDDPQTNVCWPGDDDTPTDPTAPSEPVDDDDDDPDEDKDEDKDVGDGDGASAREDEDDELACSVGGRSAHGALPLLALLLMGVRRRRC